MQCIPKVLSEVINRLTFKDLVNESIFSYKDNKRVDSDQERLYKSYTTYDNFYFIKSDKICNVFVHFSEKSKVELQPEVFKYLQENFQKGEDASIIFFYIEARYKMAVAYKHLSEDNITHIYLT